MALNCFFDRFAYSVRCPSQLLFRLARDKLFAVAKHEVKASHPLCCHLLSFDKAREDGLERYCNKVKLKNFFTGTVKRRPPQCSRCEQPSVLQVAPFPLQHTSSPWRNQSELLKAGFPWILSATSPALPPKPRLAEGLPVADCGLENMTAVSLLNNQKTERRKNCRRLHRIHSPYVQPLTRRRHVNGRCRPMARESPAPEVRAWEHIHDAPRWPAPSGLKACCPKPRALPWAGMGRPVGAVAFGS